MVRYFVKLIYQYCSFQHRLWYRLVPNYSSVSQVELIGHPLFPPIFGPRRFLFELLGEHPFLPRCPRARYSRYSVADGVMSFLDLMRSSEESTREQS